MVIVRYTPDQLQRLRESPLVAKPEGLPDIQQWNETTDAIRQAAQNQKRPRTQSNRIDEISTNDGGQQRPSLFQARHSSRSCIVSEDVVLGPPKSAFASSARNHNRNAEAAGKPSPTAQDDEAPYSERLTLRDSFFKARDSERVRDRNSLTNGRRGERDEGEGWTNTKSRKSFGQEEGDRWQKNGDRDKDKAPFDRPWVREGNKDSKEVDSNRSGARNQGWRDRERRDDREWTRGGRPENRVEEDPEWMDAPAKPEKKEVHTQEDFQRWKELMKAGSKPPEEKAEPVKEVVDESILAIKGSAVPSKPVTPLPLEGGFERMFGNLGENKKSETASTESPAVASKNTFGKAKSSRFKGFFTPQEDAPPLPPPPELVIPSGLPSGLQVSSDTRVKGTDEDKEGFQRILQMLGGTNLAPTTAALQQQNPIVSMAAPPLPPPPQDAHHSTHAQGLESAHPSRQRIHSPHDKAALLDAALSPRGPSGDTKGLLALFGAPSTPSSDAERQRTLKFDEALISNGRPDQPPARIPSMPPAPTGLQGLIGPHGGQGQQLSLEREREFFLNLMHARPNPPQSSNPSRRPPESDGFSIFLDDQAPKAPNPKPRAMPHSFFDDRGFIENNMPPREPSMQSDLPRKPAQRPPPGLFEDPSVASLQRRNTSDDHSRHRPTNMGIPQQLPHDHLYMKSSGMPPQQPQDRNIGPPPGFSAGGMRHPPGFAPLNIPLPVGNPPLGHPGLPRGMAGGAIPGGPAGMYQQQMPPPPPGFFTGHGGAPPPGFGHMPMPPQEGLMGMGMGAAGMAGPPRRGQFEMYGDLGRGGGGKPPYGF